MPHAYTPTLALAARWPRHQWQRVCVCVCVQRTARNFRNGRTTIEGSKTVAGSLYVWVFCYLLFCCSLPHIGLALRVRARPFAPHSVFVVFMTLICEQQLHLLLTQAHTVCVHCAHTGIPEKKNSYDTWTHIKVPPMPFTWYVLPRNAVKSRRQNVFCCDCFPSLSTSIAFFILLFTHSPFSDLFFIYLFYFILITIRLSFEKKKRDLCYTLHVVIFNAWPVLICNSALSQSLCEWI